MRQRRGEIQPERLDGNTVSRGRPVRRPEEDAQDVHSGRAQVTHQLVLGGEVPLPFPGLQLGPGEVKAVPAGAGLEHEGEEGAARHLAEGVGVEGVAGAGEAVGVGYRGERGDRPGVSGGRCRPKGDGQGNCQGNRSPIVHRLSRSRIAYRLSHICRMPTHRSGYSGRTDNTSFHTQAVNLPLGEDAPYIRTLARSRWKRNDVLTDFRPL